MKHELLCVIPSLTRLKSPRSRRVVLPESNFRIWFETPNGLRDLHRVQGVSLCAILGEGLLDSFTWAAVRTRLSREPHEDCPAAAVDLSKYMWL